MLIDKVDESDQSATECCADDVLKDDGPYVIFKVRAPGADLKDHCATYVVGSVPCLGDWDSEHAVPMFTTKEMYPWWTSLPLAIFETPTRRAQRVEYKYCLKSWAPNRLGQTPDTRWEVVTPRCLVLPLTEHDNSIVIADTFGSAVKGKLANVTDDEVKECVELCLTATDCGFGPPYLFGGGVKDDRFLKSEFVQKAEASMTNAAEAAHLGGKNNFAPSSWASGMYEWLSAPVNLLMEVLFEDFDLDPVPEEET